MINRVTILCENSVMNPLPFIGEHGLAMLLEGEDDATLFDTGQGMGLMHNLKILGKGISSVKRVIISHGHYDHTGGLMQFLKVHEGEIPVFLGEGAFIPKVAQAPAGEVRSIGFQEERESYEENGARFHEVKGFTKITDSISTINSIRHEPEWRPWDRMLKIRSGTGVEDDLFGDDLSILIDTPSGPVVLLGCAHSGMVEILDQISEITGLKKFYAVIGGTHLDSAPEEYVLKAIDSVKSYGVEKIAVSHCTGFRVASRFASVFGEKFINASVGRIFEF